MVKYFITSKNGIITGFHCGDINADFSNTPYNNHDRIEVPSSATVRTGDHVKCYDSGWKRKPLLQLIDEGLMQIPPGYIRKDSDLRPMTEEERIIYGLDKLKPGFKIENEKLVEMTYEEKIATGIITSQQLTEQATRELNYRLAIYQTPEALAQAELDEEYAKKRREKMASLLAVKKQKTWPKYPIWPD